MVLLMDVGNTNIVVGVVDGDKKVLDFRLSTDYKKTSDEVSIQLITMFQISKLSIEEIEGCIISSVVPNVMYTLEHSVRKLFGIAPLIVGPGIKTGMNLKIDNPKEIGADRIVNAVAAYQKYKKELIIIDFGTATTFCHIRKNGDYNGGLIVPGLKISSDALFEKAAKLPRIEIVKTERVIGKNTVTSMQSGILLGYVGQTEYIIDKMKAEMKELYGEDPIVVATGGFSALISKETSKIDKVEPYLTLEGLKILYDKNK